MTKSCFWSGVKFNVYHLSFIVYVQSVCGLHTGARIRTFLLNLFNLFHRALGLWRSLTSQTLNFTLPHGQTEHENTVDTILIN